MSPKPFARMMRSTSSACPMPTSKAMSPFAHGGIERFNVRRGDIGRVGNDAVELAELARGLLARVHAQARHAGRELVAADVLAADLERLLVPLAEQHAAAQHLTGDGEADAAAARAQVEHTAVRAGVQLVDDRLHQHLGVGARDEHGG